ncbi:hypothetical protein F2Q69_00061397 [Brassica cretica]|uniref:Uncharacterized protein n=1 Tax=Brassica cretica TaxID=69181 RepID=A0A8S9RIW5_BRACR|nr:hypothetical protein F2Q69_00061397 [Brassica cretica]
MGFHLLKMSTKRKSDFVQEVRFLNKLKLTIMEISQLYLSNLKTGRFKDVVVTRLLRFWGVGTLKKGGELMGEGGHGIA